MAWDKERQCVESRGDGIYCGFGDGMDREADRGGKILDTLTAF